jgi:hypothetical protein
VPRGIVDDTPTEHARERSPGRRRGRRAMRDRVKISQVWRRRRDGAEFVVFQTHHRDREAEMRGVDGVARVMVSYSDLRTKWRPVS